MAQEKVTRQELLDMHVGQTRIITLTERTKIDSARVTCQQLKKLRKGEFGIKPDYDTSSVSITRIK